MNEELKTMFALAKESSEKDADNERLREDNERLRKLLKECQPFIEAYDPWDCELMKELEKEVGDECD
ncbi:hypothetical protein N8510_01325 [bacterium]|nr:hypothetical protein [bacterium]